MDEDNQEQDEGNAAEDTVEQPYRVLEWQQLKCGDRAFRTIRGIADMRRLRRVPGRR